VLILGGDAGEKGHPLMHRWAGINKTLDSTVVVRDRGKKAKDSWWKRGSVDQSRATVGERGETLKDHSRGNSRA